ncbi:hypothetical protein IAR55_000351 [Kwoniella newhampshirensis]|uniref:Uncharacterized protein n=1 Tax=Kwoniella newhampshirensis TaxID=1651941 RepID=A0AAW0Z6H6_9TREE
MSKQVYEETQAFLSEKWGPMGGWCQAVMFAADLPQAQVRVKKEKTAQTESSVTELVSPVKRTLDDSSIMKTELKRTRSATRLHVKRSVMIKVKEELEK